MRQTKRRMLAILCVAAILLGLTACQTSETPKQTQPALQDQNTQPTKSEQTDPQPTEPAPVDPEPTDPTLPEPQPTDPKPTEPKPTQPKPTQPQPTEPPSEVETMQALLAPGEDNWYNYLLNSSFAKPEDIRAYSVFCNGFSDVPRFLPNKEEVEYLRGKVWGDNLEKKMLVRLSPERMDEILKKYAGVTLSQVDTSLLTYWEKTNTYYCVFTQKWETELNVQSVEHRDDGSVRVYYTKNAGEEMVAGFLHKDDTYQILFNLPERMMSDDPDIAAMQALFDWQYGTRFYNDALTSEYATPADVNLAYLFYDGFRDEPQEATEAETAFLNTKWSENWVYMDLHRLPSKKIDAVLTELFGITLEQTNRVGLEGYPYFEETDCYYNAFSGTHYADITINRVEHRDDGTIRMYYLRNGFPSVNMVATLKSNGESYQILSNLPEAVVTDDPEITAMQFLFDAQFGKEHYNDALKLTYENPKDIDLYELFYNGFSDEYRDATAQEQVLLKGKIVGSWQRNLIRLPAEKMDAALTEMFGITLEQTNKVGLDKLVYLEETDCYYSAGHGTHDVDMTVQRVEHQQDGTILVYYNRENYSDSMVVALRQNGNTYQILSNLPETAYMDPEERAALEIVEEKIRLYKLYKFIGIACEYENTGYVDLSRFLTEEQKKEYFAYQYKILCCHTAEEAKAHIDKHFGDHVGGGYSEDKLFTDDEGNLYVIVIPTDMLSYNYVEILECSDTQIIATAKVSDLSETFAVATFTLQKIDGEFVIVSVTTENL